MSATENTSSSIVIVGASSGGIDAVSQMVQDLPTDFPAPVLVAQHFDPERQSQLVGILRRHTGLTVQEVEDHASLEAGVIYVIPANRIVEFADTEVSVRKDGVRRPAPSIDRLLESAAHAYGERVIAVILTGSGTDGTSGAHIVKEHDGTVIIQDPQTAEYPSMPRSLAPTSVDFVRGLSQIGELLVDLVSRPQAPEPVKAMGDGDMDAFLEHLRSESSIDFSQYKRPTIMRRLHRRLVATESNSLDEYRNYLQQSPDEYYQLISSFLIKVTEFFRDTELFDHLRTTVVPELIEQGRARGNQLRVWSAGSATGEEAYSLAILVAEALGEEINRFNVRIFATDIDDSAVNFARRGVYSRAALREMPDELKTRFFSSVDGEYEISKQVRSMVVFGQHDLAQRSPFPSIDLILCRNVLIYFTGDLQRRALQLFSYSLRNGGFLVLGKSESTSPLSDYFIAEDNRLKIYRRQGEPTPIPVGPVDTTIFSTPRHQPSSSWSGAPIHADRPTRDSARTRKTSDRNDGVLFHLPVGIVVVDRNYDVRTLNNRARHFLGIHGPAVGEDLLHLIRTIPLETLRDPIDQAFRQGGLIKVEGEWEIETVDGERLFIEMSYQHQEPDPEGQNGQTVVVVLTDITDAVVERQRILEERDNQRTENQRLTDRDAQLFRINQQLVESNRELAEANEELRTTNEQLLVSNEEAQAAAEEIETLNEELQTTNEELETLNEELQATVEELNATNEDMRARTLELQDERMRSEEERARLESVLISMADAVLLIDRQANIVLVNDACREMFGDDISQLRLESDNGESLATHESPINRAARGEAFTIHFTIRISESERRWYEATGRPVVEDAESPGSVVVIRDITDRSLRLLQEEFMSVAGHELRTPLTALRGYLEMLRQHLDASDERSQRYVTVSLDMVTRLVGLISDLLDVGRLQAGKFDLTFEETDLNSLIEQTVEVAQPMTTTHTIELDTPDTAVVATVDPTRLQQVVLNLLSNAIQYSPEADQVLVTLKANENDVEIDIQDFGVGMTQEAVSQIFSRFYQGENSRSTGLQRGLGLGLFISKEIADAHHGHVSVESTPGEGSTFSVRIPRSIGAEQAAGPED